jgi:hypothetical protein
VTPPGLTTLLKEAAAVILAAAGAYGPAEYRCGFTDTRISESSGAASASWDADVIWTHNDSGDGPRFFAVDTEDCDTLAAYDLTGADAQDWEDMARAGDTLHFGDIGDNRRERRSVTVYSVTEPDRDAAPGAVPVAAHRVLTYPDGAHDAETLLADPTTGRLVIVTKEAGGTSGVYRAPESGDVLEKVADVTLTGITPAERFVTGGDASKDRLVLRTYLTAAEWDIRPGDSLAAALGRSPVPIALPITPQGEAIAYTADGAGLWTTSEAGPGQPAGGGPVHRLDPLGAPDIRPQGAEPEEMATEEAAGGEDGADSAWPTVAAGGAAVLVAVAVVYGVLRRGRRLT